MARSGKTVLVLASVLVAVAIFNLVMASGISSGISSKTKSVVLESAESSRPANISVVSIVPENCPDCFDISRLVSELKSAPVSVVNEKSIGYTSAEAKQLIQKYRITKVPALVITGEVDKQNVRNSLSGFGAVVGDARVFSSPPPVYLDAVSGAEVGRVSATLILADSCSQCNNIYTMVQSLKAAGVTISSEKNYDYGSNEGKALLKEYNITKVPAIIFSGDLAAYPEIKQEWERIGTVEKDGSYVVRNTIPPYIDTATGVLNGLVSITYLADKSCTECYNVSLHKNVLSSYGVSLSNETIYDISSPDGIALISKYNISLVPTIVLSSQAGAYPQLSSIWERVGSIEKDGNYVFRAAELMGAYKDLPANKIIAPEKSGSAQ